MSNFIVGFGINTNEYTINGVRYIVENRFMPVDYKNMKKNPKINNQLEKYITSDFADLPSVQSTDKMEAEYVCSGCMTSNDVWKEDNNAVEK